MRSEPRVPESVLDRVRAPFLVGKPERIDPAVIQPLNLLLDLSGEAMRERLFVVQGEKGAEACLRPDFTIPVARSYVVEAVGDALERQYYYQGQAFRMPPASGGEDHPSEFLQIGMESFGGGGENAESQMAGLAWKSAMAGGRTDLSLRIGDVGLFAAFLEDIGTPEIIATRLRRAFSRPQRLKAELARAATRNPDAGRIAAALAGQATREQDLRSFLGTFNFSGDMVKQAVGSMSGGEKARLVLCMIVWQRPNLLLLDEPTNHLDLATREALGMALNEFEGTVMLVSHDRALLRSVCDEFWMVSHGGVAPFDGDLDDYQRYLLDEAKRAREAVRQEQVQASKALAAAKAAPIARPLPVATADKRRLEKDIAHLDARMQALSTEGSALESQLAANPAPQELASLGKRLKAVNEQLQDLEEKWLAASAELEALLAGA